MTSSIRARLEAYKTQTAVEPAPPLDDCFDFVRHFWASSRRHDCIEHLLELAAFFAVIGERYKPRGVT